MLLPGWHRVATLTAVLDCSDISIKCGLLCVWLLMLPWLQAGQLCLLLLFQEEG
jgi:hypothetical protein